MRNITFVFIFFISLFGYAQELSVLQGKIVGDSLEIDGMHIINQTQNTGVINDESGSFQIRANPGDTIIFSSIQYAIKQHVVTQKDIDLENFIVKLEHSVNRLDEVFITQHTLTGRIEDDLLQIPTYTENLPFWNAAELKQMGVGTFNDAQSPVQNLVLPNANGGLAGASVDLKVLAGGLSSIFRKSKGITPKIEKSVYFNEKIVIEQLEIPETEYYNFVDFINEQPATAIVLNYKDKLKVLEFLMDQSKVFKEKYNIKK